MTRTANDVLFWVAFAPTVAGITDIPAYILGRPLVLGSIEAAIIAVAVGAAVMAATLLAERRLPT